MSKHAVTDDQEDGPHPTQSKAKRFSTDQKLRAAGFAILSRPANGEPIWIKRGIRYRQTEALLRLKADNASESA